MHRAQAIQDGTVVIAVVVFLNGFFFKILGFFIAGENA